MNRLRAIRGYLRSISGTQVLFVCAFAIGLLVLVGIAFALSLISPPEERLFVSRTGYTFRYPADWIVENVHRDSSYESELIRDPSGRATIAISSHSEPRLRELMGRAAITKEIELAFLQDESYTLDFLDWISPDLGAPYNGYTASGSFENDDSFIFREIGIFDPLGEKITFRSEVRNRNAPELVPIVDEILLSVRPDPGKRLPELERSVTMLSADEARALVEQLPYVALDRESAFERGEKHTLEVEDGGALWHVRLYAEGEGVKFPVSRWRVDKQTGAISKVLP